MSDKPSLLQKVRDFTGEVVVEVKKSSWPDRKTLMAHTAIVIVSVFLMGLFIGVSDFVLARFLRFLVPHS